MSWLDRLHDHPFAVDAYFDFSLVLTYALPVEVLRPRVPSALTIDTYQDRWAFVAIAMVKTRGLRPSRLPAFFGRDFFLIGTRIFVRFQPAQGARLRGLYILRSETDRRAMTVLGDLFTRYRYEHRRITVEREGPRLRVRSGDFHVAVDITAPTAALDDPALLPPGSPFTDWKDARRFAGPMPHTFSALGDHEVLVVEGVRQSWRPRPVRVEEAVVPYFAEQGLADPVLASAFVIEGVPYHWAPGRRERGATTADDGHDDA
jgi:uncharacterized protein YqjF (DUF2071 family)